MKVVHCKRNKYDVYIGRGKNSIWGNPFIVGKDGTLEDVLKKYEIYLRKNKKLMSKIMELNDKTLGCWCLKEPIDYIRKKPRCHGEIIMKIIEEEKWSLGVI